MSAGTVKGFAHLSDFAGSDLRVVGAGLVPAPGMLNAFEFVQLSSCF
jgi:hypothetical protein